MVKGYHVHLATDCTFHTIFNISSWNHGCSLTTSEPNLKLFDFISNKVLKIFILILLALKSCVSAPLVPHHIDIWWDVLYDALQDIFHCILGGGSYFTISGLRCRHVLIKIQIRSIDCVIRLVQPGRSVLIQPVIYDQFPGKSFCVIIWGNSMSECNSFRSIS